MIVEDKALKFAINAHKGQLRKSEPDKPMIFHPINVGHILKEYGFDENVIAAGFLHDVVEDTSFTFDDIKKEFGEDIESLVYGASEPDKSLPWIDRKKYTIETIKDLDIRHKAVVCADKISNLEDLHNLFGKNGKIDFSCFKKGFTEQDWYYSSIYESLVYGEEKNYPMFERLRDLIDKVFHADDTNIYLRNIIFDDDLDRYDKLIKLHHKKQELIKLKSLSKDIKPYIIEFTGTPRTGKTTLISNLEDYFKKGEFSVDIIEEFTTSKRYKEEIYPTLKDKSKNVINTEIPKYAFEQLIESIEKNKDIILVDRSLFDRLIWADRLYLKKGFTDEEYEEYKDKYLPLIKEYINDIIATYTDPITSLKRDYKAHLSLEERHFLNQENVEEYNTSLSNAEELVKINQINIQRIDTTNKPQDDVSIEVANIVVDNIRTEYIKRLEKEYNIEC